MHSQYMCKINYSILQCLTDLLVRVVVIRDHLNNSYDNVWAQ